MYTGKLWNSAMNSYSCHMKIPVRYNHVGYTPDSAKIFFVNPQELESACADVKAYKFRVVRRVYQGAELSTVWEGSFTEGTFEHKGVCEYTGESLWSGDFSDVRETGIFTIQILKKGVAEGDALVFETQPFEISTEWLYRQLLANIKSFYYQRSGVDLTSDFAGKWARKAAHLDDCIGFHPSMNREGTWNAHGGWYDAGDYGKYIVNGGVSVATLLLACEMFGESVYDSRAFKAIYS